MEAQLNPGTPQTAREAAAVYKARFLFYLGFACLPMFWLANFLHYNERPDAPELAKAYARKSLYAFGVALVALVAWWIVFATQWQLMGDIGRELLLTPPV